MFRKIAIAMGALLLIVAATLWYYWRQATALPDWYTEDAVGSQSPIDRASRLEVPNQLQHGSNAPPLQWETSEKLASPPEQSTRDSAQPKSKKDQSKTRKKKQPRSRELRNFHVRQLARHPQLKKSIRSSRALYKDGKLEAGVVIDISAIPRETLSERDRVTLDRMLKAFPPLRGKSVYLGIEDYPERAGDILQLSSKTSIHIGQLKLTLNQVGKKIGSSGISLRRMFNRELRAIKAPHPQGSDLPELDE